MPPGSSEPSSREDASGSWERRGDIPQPNIQLIAREEDTVAHKQIWTEPQMPMSDVSPISPAGRVNEADGCGREY